MRIAVLALVLGLPALSGCASVDEYELLTHCGITHAIVDRVVYLADPELSDGNGNPPLGWGNPFQRGVLTVNSDGTADFRAGRLTAHFVRSELSVSDLPLCS